ncbi:hypothetical protein TIFTF001_037515 [Ficus carica]|uniref:Ubiquitin-like protease family profile domain-containing protein n=1 Tax=Ficus carica TaxID=3494 RepID=A0AA88E675_FICCA|nr:hypothetical protein TIFTF001_037515 [Ficus carica]
MVRLVLFPVSLQGRREKLRSKEEVGGVPVEGTLMLKVAVGCLRPLREIQDAIAEATGWAPRVPGMDSLCRTISLQARKRGERIEVTFDEKGFRSTCLKSCGEAARNFRHDHYKTFVEDFVTEDSVWTRPHKVIDNYPNIEEEDWVKFVQYRTSSQFQQLSDRGSEIRTNREYTLRGGRDGYRKLDQKKFKETGKWEKRDGLWLDSRTGSDGELKDPSCQKMQYNTQESQGTFESVGTTDVLTQALSRSEHPGQLKALVRGLCAKKDAEPLFDQENVPTVGQHNSFKTSCSIQEKQHGVSNPPTMPIDSQECKLYISMNFMGDSCLLRLEEHGWRAFHRYSPWDSTGHVPDQAAERNKCQKKLEKKPINSRTEVQQDAQQHKALFDFNKMNMEMRPLAYYAHSSMREGNHIEVPIPYTITGFDMLVFLNFDDIYEFINLQEISANCILVYIRINGRAEKFVFVSPTLISPVRVDTPYAGLRERADALVAFLHDAPKGRLYLVPHNRGRHWVLGIIDPWEDLPSPLF